MIKGLTNEIKLSGDYYFDIIACPNIPGLSGAGFGEDEAHQKTGDLYFAGHAPWKWITCNSPS